MPRWLDLEQRRKRLRLAEFNYDDTNYVYFITLCARGAGSPFSDLSLSREIIDSLMTRRNTGLISLYAYCLMPDHLHLALSPKVASKGIPQLMASFKSYSTRIAWQHGLKGKLWQRSYFDHVARRSEDVDGICDYILANPVRKGLVETVDEWPFSGCPDIVP